jgi:hypothetical protein
LETFPIWFGKYCIEPFAMSICFQGCFLATRVASSGASARIVGTIVLITPRIVPAGGGANDAEIAEVVERAEQELRQKVGRRRRLNDAAVTRTCVERVDA